MKCRDTFFLWGDFGRFGAFTFFLAGFKYNRKAEKRIYDLDSYRNTDRT